MPATEKNDTRHAKTLEIISELKILGLWRKNEPVWVKDYEANTKILHDDFAEWLQFVYLPNIMQKKAGTTPSIVPQAMKYFGNDVKRGRLLQLLIELDALV